MRGFGGKNIYTMLDNTFLKIDDLVETLNTGIAIMTPPAITSPLNSLCATVAASYIDIQKQLLEIKAELKREIYRESYGYGNTKMLD